MWFAVGIFIICFTIIVLFRMYIDLRRVDHQHVRMLQNDIRSYEKYQHVRQLEAPKAEMPDFNTALEIQRQQRRVEAYAIPPARYYGKDDLTVPFPKPTPAQVRALEPTVMYKKAALDTRLLDDEQLQRIIDANYNEFIRDQQRRRYP